MEKSEQANACRCGELPLPPPAAACTPATLPTMVLHLRAAEAQHERIVNLVRVLSMYPLGI